MRELHYETSTRKLSVVHLRDAMATTCLDHLSSIRRRATTVGLQHNPAAIMCPLPDVRGSPSCHWMVGDERYVLYT